MARYYAEIEGNHSLASRLGSAKSGMRANARGWNIGAEITCLPDPNDPEADGRLAQMRMNRRSDK
jgi:hypothetical protein